MVRQGIKAAGRGDAESGGRKRLQSGRFIRLIREGIGLGEWAPGLMTEMSLTYFTDLTDAEIADLHQYLQNLPQWQ